MTKVITFSDTSRFALEDAINKWMARQDKTFKVINVSFSVVAVNDESLYGCRYSALVAYEIG